MTTPTTTCRPQRLPAVARCTEGADPAQGCGVIYVLVDPRHDTVRYVGKTVDALAARLSGHLHSKNALLRQWVRDLATAGHRPILRVVREVPLAGLDDAERRAIADFASDGWPLFNLTGIPAQVVSDSAVAAVRARRARAMATAEADWAEAERRRLVQQDLDMGTSAAAHAALFAVAQRVSGGPLPPPIRALRSADVTSLPEELARHLPGGDQYPPADLFDRGQVCRATARFMHSWGIQVGVFRSRDYLPKVVHDLCEHLEDEMRFDGDPERFPRYRCQRRWRSQQDMLKVAALAEWHRTAVVPWRAAAEAAKLPSSGAGFARAVTDDPDVRAALETWECAPWTSTRGDDRDQLDPLSLYCLVTPYADDGLRWVADDAAARVGLAETFATLARANGLTAPAVAMFHRVDQDAVSRTYGVDVARMVDGRVGLPDGTSRRVLADLVEIIRGLPSEQKPPRDAAASDFLRAVLAPREMTPAPYPFWRSGVMVTTAVSQVRATFDALIVRGVASPPPKTDYGHWEAPDWRC